MNRGMEKKYPLGYLYLNKHENDRISVSCPPQTFFEAEGQFSIDAWIRLEDVNSAHTIFSQDNVFRFYVNDGLLQFEMAGYTPVAKAVSVLTPGEWHYAAVTCYEQMISLIVDDGPAEDFLLEGNRKEEPGEFWIGEGFSGDIRQVRVYPVCMTADELGSLRYQTAETANMSAYYDFTMAPPEERKSGSKIILEGNARILYGTPAAVYMEGGFCEAEPNAWTTVNPGGNLNQPYTVQVWFRLDPLPDGNVYTLFSNTDENHTAGMELQLFRDKDDYYLQAVHGNSQTVKNVLKSKTPVTTNQWINAAVVYEDKELRLYLNGELCAESKEVEEVLQPLASGRVRIGGGMEADGSGTECFRGGISRADVWTKALSAKELSLYMSEEPAGQEGLCGSWVLCSRITPNSCDCSPLVRVNEVHVKEMLTEAAEGQTESKRPLHSAFRKEPLSLEELQKCRDQCMKNVRKLAGAGDLNGEELFQKPICSSWHKEESVYFVIHCPEGSYTAASIEKERLGDKLDEWRIEVILTVISSLLDLILSVHIAYNPQTADFILDCILTLTAIQTAFSMVKDGDSSSAVDFVYSILKTMWKENRLMILLKMMVQISFWGFLAMMAKLAGKMINPWVYLAVWASKTAVILLLLFKRKPRENPPITVSNIEFHHRVPGKIDAVSIRKNAKETWPTPEWQADPPKSGPAVYRLSSFTGTRDLMIRVQFSASREVNGTFRIRGNADTDRSMLLGSTGEISVSFVNGVMQTEWADVLLLQHQMAGAGIQKKEIAWDWEYYDPDDDAWVSMLKTSHTIYTILGNVNSPWQRGTDVRLDLSSPWTDILDIIVNSSQFSMGNIRTIDSALSAVTEMVYQNLKLKYGGMSGISAWGGGQSPVFLDLQSFLSDYPQIQTVNCQDCAALVTVFANILGCDLRPMILVPDDGQAFQTEKLLLIGESAWRYPVEEKKGEGYFSYHWAAVPRDKAGAANSDTPVYDACMKFNNSGTPWDDNQRIPALAEGMPLSQYPAIPPIPPIQTPPVIEDSYREHVCANTKEGIQNCVRGAVTEVVLGNP